ncbi:hypothetical protein GARC_0693 [Paraglaciecola arctica BSs20135]|uniref:Uncharacterized protein n=1 Tax=Paraglaciecola arctica BSs20135 TaxID=493475 RepID=K6XAL6_9ALTE|nr:hypothetical protein GARC_0693 [Paraglaciecola arctica BSs20135]
MIDISKNKSPLAKLQNKGLAVYFKLLKLSKFLNKMSTAYHQTLSGKATF